MTPNLQPVLADDIVRLRPLQAEDWEALFAVASDPEIWAGHPAHDRWQEAVFRKFFDDALESGGAMIVEDAATDKVIGSSRFDARRADEGEVEIGWTFLARSHWGAGTNAAMKRLMIRHALQFYDRVIFLVGSENIISRRAMTNIGGVLTDRLDIVELAGETVTHVIFAIDQECFENGPMAKD